MIKIEDIYPPIKRNEERLFLAFPTKDGWIIIKPKEIKI